MIIPIEIQDVHRGSTHGCFAKNVDPERFEVILPTLAPGVEEWHDPSNQGIDARQIGALLKIAVDTG